MDDNAFFEEQERLMNLSDDDIEEYKERMRLDRKRLREERELASNMFVEGSSMSILMARQPGYEPNLTIEHPSGEQQTPPSTPSKKRRLSAAPSTPRTQGKQSQPDITNNELLEDDSIIPSSPVSVKSKTKSQPTRTIPARSQPTRTTPARAAKTRTQNKATKSPVSSPTPARLSKPKSKPKPPISIAIPDDTDTDDRVYPSDVPTSPIEDPSAFVSSSANKEGMSLLELVQINCQAALKKKTPRNRTIKFGDENPPSENTIIESSSVAHRSSPPPPEEEPKEEKKASTSKSVKPQKTVLDTSTSKAKSKFTLGKSVYGAKSMAAANYDGKSMTLKQLEAVKVLPEEYARLAIEHYEHAQKKRAESRKGKEKEGKSVWKPYLKGLNIYYFGSELNMASEETKKRMYNILRFGGTLIPKYDPDVVTHIITDQTRGCGPLLRALGLKSLKSIPEHINIVLWSWVNDPKHEIVETPEGPQAQLAELFPHAAYGERVPEVGAGSFIARRNNGKRKANDLDKDKKGKGKAKAESESEADEGVSNIEEFTIDEIQPPAGQPKARSAAQQSTNRAIKPLKMSSRIPLNFEPEQPAPNPRPVDPDDPLAPFYERARAEAEEERFRGRAGEVNPEDEQDLEDAFSDTDRSDEEEERRRPAKRKKGFACDIPLGDRGECPNQDIIDKLQVLLDLHKAKPTDDDHWRAFTYTKVVRMLRSHPYRIKSVKDAMKLRGVGLKTATKIMEIVETGDLRRIKYETTESVKVTQVFQGIYGVGQSTALKWYASGCRTLDDLAKGKGEVKLTKAQKIGLKFYDDINERMPRDEAGAIFALIKPIALSIDSELFVEIMGSYRRGKKDCGDIDIMITRNPEDGKSHEGVLSELLRRLHKAGILTEDLALPEDPDDLEAIYRGLCRLPDQPGSKRRRIDFLTIPWKNRGAALLYYTGDDIFNRSMRWKANHMGYSLNQKGLWKGVVRDPNQRSVKTNMGTILASEMEEEIFKILGVPWQEPHERVR